MVILFHLNGYHLFTLDKFQGYTGDCPLSVLKFSCFILGIVFCVSFYNISLIIFFFEIFINPFNKDSCIVAFYMLTSIFAFFPIIFC